VTFDFDRIELNDLSRHFGRRKAVSRVSLSIQAGDILGLLGPNGAGKSTLLGMMATLVAPTSGMVSYGGFRAADHGQQIRSRIGVLAHELHLYPELTARQNLKFFADLHGLSDPALVPAALDSAGLGDRANDQVASFSRGMRQRLALERALLHEPRLLLLDEPFTGLDDPSSVALRGRLTRVREAGTIVIVTTHELEAIDTIVDAAYVLSRGRCEPLAGGTGSLRDRYRRQVQA
jgi:heme exporter protein A